MASIDKGKAAAADEEYAPLHMLRPGATSPIKVMVCRKWDVTTVGGKYRSTDFVLSDEEGHAIQCSARSNISHCFATQLEEGKVYSLKKYTVVANKDKFRIRNNDSCIIQLEGYTIVKKLDDQNGGYNRFPFQLTPIEDVCLNDSAFLIDVIGIVSEVGTVKTTPTGAELLEFRLLSDKGTRIRVTLWGWLCNDFMNRAGYKKSGYILILPSMNIKDYFGEIFLSSTSATTLFDSIDIPQIADFHSLVSESNNPVENCTPPLSAPRRVTVCELIALGREQKETRGQTMSVECKVTICSIRTKDSWFYNACGMGNCKKRVGRVGTGFWCDTCKRSCEFPRTRYRTHVVAEDGTGTVVLTLFDGPAEFLVKKDAASLLKSNRDEIGMVIVPQELLDLVGTSHVFEVKTHTYFDTKMEANFTVNKVMEDDTPDKDSDQQLGNNKRPRSPNEEVVGHPPMKSVCIKELTAAKVDAGKRDTTADSETISSDESNRTED